jgi:hypothetical protein
MPLAGLSTRFKLCSPLWPTATSTSALFGTYRWGWGFSTTQDFNGDIALIACFASFWSPPWCGGGTLIRSGSCARGTSCMGSAPPATPPSIGTGVVPFLRGSSTDLCLSKLSRDRPRRAPPCSVVERAIQTH